MTRLATILLVALGTAARGQEEPGGVPIATISLANGRVERASAGQKWGAARQGEALKTGESLRTGPDGAARLMFPWMTVALGPDTVVRVPGGRILSTVLESGRIELVSEGDIVKVRVGSLDIRGQGRIVVRHDGERTAVMSLTDVARLSMRSGRSLELQSGEAALGSGNNLRGPLAFPAPPTIVSPGADPMYVQPSTPVPLQWRGQSDRYIVEIVPLDSNTPLLATESRSNYAEISVPWLGLYRWRVTGVDRTGLETEPSEEGLICVVEK